VFALIELSSSLYLLLSYSSRKMSAQETRDVELAFLSDPSGPGWTQKELQNFCQPSIQVETVIEKLRTDISMGLSTVEAHRRLDHYGTNELSKQTKMPLWLLFLSQFTNLILIILVIAAIVSIVVGELVEGLAVIIIVIITALMGTYTEYSSGNALEALAQLTDPHTNVYRDGKLEHIRTPELVPGDIVQLSPGDLVR
jgi:P-type Ca2+ transporter type 2C